jgi:hypothetical protein
MRFEILGEDGSHRKQVDDSDSGLKKGINGGRPNQWSPAASEWSKRFMAPVGTSWRWQRCRRLARGGGPRGGARGWRGNWRRKRRPGLTASVDGP